MSEVQTWPEQNAVEAWLAKYGIAVTFEQSMELKKSVSAYRINQGRKLESQAKRIAELEAQLSKPIRNSLIVADSEAHPAHAHAEKKLRWHLDENAVSFLNEMITADDDGLTEILLHVGHIQEDGGTVKYGLLVSDAEYPEEGASLLVEMPKPVAQPAQSVLEAILHEFNSRGLLNTVADRDDLIMRVREILATTPKPVQ